MKKLLIANRGEIAVRIIRTARRLGISTVAIHSQCDEDSLHVQIADESVCVGPNRAKDSYLNLVAIMSACELTGADAVHPGYGFMSENPEFAEVVQQCGVTFVGPNAESMRMMGAKVGARAIAKAAGVPMLEGSGVLASVEEAKKIADAIGYPVLIKASNGGGGRGMRVVRHASELDQTFHSARSESQTAFGSADVFIEKFVERPRHIEIQILADQHGNVIHLGERECSIQRRHQKIIEEAPSVFIDEKVRQKMGDAACELARVAKYVGVGTVEFLMDDDKKFYFMEMNTRIQVEHPVTEMVTGLDLVEEQIRVARGEKLRHKQSDIKLSGHAIECRINAEDPYTFIPCPGTIQKYLAPGGRGIRLDSAAFAGSKIPPFYDSMIGKLIAYESDREKTVDLMLSALAEFKIEGIKTNIPLHREMMMSQDYRTNNIYTKWIEEDFLKRRDG